MSPTVLREKIIGAVDLYAEAVFFAPKAYKGTQRERKQLKSESQSNNLIKPHSLSQNM
jgi:hypothetical protein